MFIESELRISDHKLFNIACDLVCDQYIKDVPDNMWDQLKDKYPDLVKNLEKDKGAKYYYEELIKYAQKNSSCGNLSIFWHLILDNKQPKALASSSYPLYITIPSLFHTVTVFVLEFQSA